MKWFSLLALLFMVQLAQADWRQFRGNDTTALPTELQAWSGELSEAWSAELPGRGLASPIIVGDRVFVSASAGPRQQRLHVLCFDAKTGKQLWDRTTWTTGRTACHPKTCVAAPSPASDGERVFAFFSSNDVVCYDLDGNLQWFRGLTYDYPNASNSLGMASSLVVINDTLVAMVECDVESFSIGLNTQDGTTRWKIDRPRAANWTSPVIWPESNTVLLQSSAGVSAVDAKTGEELWKYADGASTMPSLVVAGEIAYVPSNGITAIRPGRSNEAVPEIVWQEGSLSPGTASPLVLGEQILFVNRGGVLTSAATKDGERLWQARMKGPFSASPVIAGDKIVYVNEEGLVQVADPADEGKTLSTHELSEVVLGTPSVSDGAIYVRSDGHLWKLNMN